MSRGTTLGRYTLIEQLAVGGMAEIWLAHMAGPEGFEKLLVIKKILPHLSQRTNFLKMFLNEARLAAKLNHPNIVQIYDLGKVDDAYFIAMEYIFGRDLSEIGHKARLKERPVPIEYATKIMSQVCEGLYYAHNKTDTFGNPLNIVHRDVSPHNVLVSFAGNVKILDFGIAKAANQYDQTQQGILKGKVSYMSPEQIWGDPVDARSDLFSLGAVFYELVTGFRLFTGENDMAILRMITEEKVEPPSTFNPDIPPDLEAILLGMLDKDPASRYPNAWELQQDLNLLLKRLGNPTNIHMAQFLRELFDDEMDAERLYLQQKIEELVHAQVLPPIEEEETLIVFAGSQELSLDDMVEEDSQEVTAFSSHPAAPEPPNPWLDEEEELTQAQAPLPDPTHWSEKDLELSLPTSEVQRPLQDQPSIRIVAEATNPEMAPSSPPPSSPPEPAAVPVGPLRPSAPPNGEGVPSEATTEHPSPLPPRASSPLFATLQQPDVLASLQQRRDRSSLIAQASHSEAHRNASYVGAREGLSGYDASTWPPPRPAPAPPSSSVAAPSLVAPSSPSPSTPPESLPVASSTPLTPQPLTPQPVFAPGTSRESAPLSGAGSSGALFVPMSAAPRRNGDIPVVLSFAPNLYDQLSERARHEDTTVPALVHRLITQTLQSAEHPGEANVAPCHSPPRSHRVARATKKD